MLGAQHNPFETVNDAGAPNFKVPNLGLTAGVSIHQLDDRRSLSKRFSPATAPSSVRSCQS